MTRLPIEPYWVNAAEWWISDHNSNNEEFSYWLHSQGVFPARRESFYPWLEFEDANQALLFQLRWA